MADASSPAGPPVVDPAAALAASQLQVHALQVQVQALAEQAHRMQAHVADVESAARGNAAAAAAAVADARHGQRASAPPRLPKIPEPITFNGATGTFVDTFIHGLDKQFEYYHGSFTTEDMKVGYASNFLGVHASAWYTNLKGTLAEQDPAVYIRTWEQFKMYLRERYQPIGSAAIARRSLDSFTQKGSVQAYTDHFHKCMAYIKDRSDADQVHGYINGLKDSIRNEVRRRVPAPQTAHEAINYATHAEAFLGHAVAPSFATGASSGRFQRNGYNNSNSSASSSSGAVAMDVNAVDGQDAFDGQDDTDDSASSASPSQFAQLQQANAKFQQQILAMFTKNGVGSKNTNAKGDRVPGVSKVDYDRCRAEGRCIKCKQVGHVARECHNAAKSNF